MNRPFIVGDKIYLRALGEEDMDLMAKWFNDPEVRHFIPANKPTSREHWEKWHEKEEKDGNSVYLGIAKKEDDKLIGYANFSEINWSHHITKEFGIIIGEIDEWNKGYGEEAIKLMLHYGFNSLNFHRIELGVMEYNERAINIYEKVGFKKEGIKREAWFIEGKWCDVVIMSILKHEYTNSKVKE
ncbi:MAG: GNAT family N-acetyltransferase [Thermoplasmata archaeon]|nr:MAG: GNAT family N-acetyltransferase [Thermoplasmata archaeon]